MNQGVDIKCLNMSLTPVSLVLAVLMTLSLGDKSICLKHPDRLFLLHLGPFHRYHRWRYLAVSHACHKAHETCSRFILFSNTHERNVQCCSNWIFCFSKSAIVKFSTWKVCGILLTIHGKRYVSRYGAVVSNDERYCLNDSKS